MNACNRTKPALFPMAAVILGILPLTTMAADTSTSPGMFKEQPIKEGKTPQKNYTDTLQQRIDIRKKTKAHWRDPPAGDRASELKAMREQLGPNTKQAAPTKTAPDTSK